MQYTTTLLALASVAIAAPLASCPIEPVSFEITDFHFNGVRGPVITEDYSFTVAGNVGPSATTCQAVNAGGNDNCQVAFRNVEPTACANDDFTFSFIGSDETSFVLEVNYTLPNCGTLTGCRIFPASDIQCVQDRNVHYENLTAPTSFTLQAMANNKCIFH